MSVQISHAPRTGGEVAGPRDTTRDGLEAVLHAAAAARQGVATTCPAERSRWLESLADALESGADELIAIADEETALGVPRLSGELAKAAANARYYGRVGARGAWMRARIQRGAPDLRRAHLPIGVVAVFGASNFPFQFGTLGHDTCSALAAGCPVVVKEHPAHPRLARALSSLAVDALADAGAPQGVFAGVAGFDVGQALVLAPEVSAVGFTGSQRGGLALVDLAAQRPVPIPVYAEMGTVNPAVVTPAATDRMDEVVSGFVDSFTLGVGQFCTKPGLLLAPRGSGAARAVADEVRTREGAWLLTRGIADSYRSGVEDLVAAGGSMLAQGSMPATGYAARPAVLEVSADDLHDHDRLREECFGPAALVTEYDDVAHAQRILAGLQGSLAGSVITGGPGDPDVSRLVGTLAEQVGRVAVDAWPTGVACTDAMHHGGPWPSTSRPSHTSVGAEALGRFTRPVCFQDTPQEALPAALQDADPWRIEREESEGAP